MTQYKGGCPLCEEKDLVFYHKDKKREYWQCRICDVVFVPPQFHLNNIEEKAEYDLHQNSSDDTGYRKFLERILQPVLKQIPEKSVGLDFGCGPGPTLSKMFEERGHDMRLYDVYYFPEESALNCQYDFVTTSEVVEHLAHPMEVFSQLWQIVKEEGVLAVMTKRVQGREAFSSWHYKNDPTHITFYSESTVRWLAERLNAELEIAGSDVFLLKKR